MNTQENALESSKLETAMISPTWWRKTTIRWRKGDSWIRKGSHQPRMIQKRLWCHIRTKNGFDWLYWRYRDTVRRKWIRQYHCTTVGEFTLPSEREARSILRAIEEKKNPSAKKPTILDLYYSSGLDLPYALTGIKPYHKRTLEELEENLRNVSKDFAADDAYFRFEENGVQVQHNSPQ